MGIIMANTKITIPTKTLRLFFAVGGAALLCFAVINVFLTFTPSSKGNLTIEKTIQKTVVRGHADELEAMREQQEALLSRKPADPFAWARYSYLKGITEGDRAKAFAALKMSNLVAPIEPRQMLERAIMWKRFADLHTAEDKAEQERFWQKAFFFSEDQTFDYARANRLQDEIGAAVMKDAALADAWQKRIKPSKAKR